MVEDGQQQVVCTVRCKRSGRFKPKTIEESDQEVVDYQAGGGEKGNGVTNCGAVDTSGMDVGAQSRSKSETCGQVRNRHARW